MNTQRDLGVTVPLAGLTLEDHRNPLQKLREAGFNEIGTGEVNGYDALTPLVLFGAWEPTLNLSAVVSAFTRGPAILAMTAAAIADAAPGRVRFAIAAGSDRVVEDWNGIPFAKPYSRVASTLRFLREVLDHGRAGKSAEELSSTGFRLLKTPAEPPRLYLAALGPRMQALAKAEADGILLNFVSPQDVMRICDHTANVIREVDSDFRVSVRVFVIPGEGESVETVARRHIAAYITVPVYAQFQRWLGRGSQLEPILSAWNSGDRARAVSSVPEALIDKLFISGSPRACSDRIQQYLAAGADDITILPFQPAGAPLEPAEQIDFLVALAGSLQSERAV